MSSIYLNQLERRLTQTLMKEDDSSAPPKSICESVHLENLNMLNANLRRSFGGKFTHPSEFADNKEMLLNIKKQKLSKNEWKAVESFNFNPKRKTSASPNFISDLFELMIERNALTNLLNNGWLNTDIINVYFNMLEERDTRGNNGIQKSTYLPAALFKIYTERNTLGFDFVKRWTKKVHIFDMQKVYVAVNYTSTHWALIVISIPETTLRYYDSLNGYPAATSLMKMKEWLSEVAKLENFPYVEAEWKTSVEDCSKQNNCHDCGVFILKFAEYTADGLSASEVVQTDMKEHRRKIAAAILKGYIE